MLSADLELGDQFSGLVLLDLDQTGAVDGHVDVTAADLEPGCLLGTGVHVKLARPVRSDAESHRLANLRCDSISGRVHAVATDCHRDDWSLWFRAWGRASFGLRGRRRVDRKSGVSGK